MAIGKAKTCQDVLALAKENKCAWVDLKFVDLIGTWQHFSITLSEVNEDIFNKEGVGFDGSSIRGFQKINESDMLLVPDPTTAIVDPACEVPTISMICDVKDPITGKPYSRDPRFVAKKAETYLKKTGIADVSYWGPELEFFIFNHISFDQNSHSGYYNIDSEEGIWNSGDNDSQNLGYRPRYKEGYFPVPPMDKQQDIRSMMGNAMMAAGIPLEVHHHEVATGGQAEFAMRFDSLTNMADKVLLYKYVCKNVAVKNGYTATFMPKPLFGDNGSGMHVHQSLWKGEGNLFYDKDGYGLTSALARNYIGGVLKHSPALLALCAPSTNSYRRLVPGYEAPINLVYSQRNRSASVRIPMYSASPKTKRIEYRCPDATCNPYLAFSAILMAGIDGVKNKIDPGEPVDKNIYELEPAEKAKIKSTPGSLDEVLTALAADHKFLLEGGVFTEDLIEEWISYKKKNELEAVAVRPHPHEFFLYYDV